MPAQYEQQSSQGRLMYGQYTLIFLKGRHLFRHLVPRITDDYIMPADHLRLSR